MSQLFNHRFFLPVHARLTKSSASALILYEIGEMCRFCKSDTVKISDNHLSRLILKEEIKPAQDLLKRTSFLKIEQISPSISKYTLNQDELHDCIEEFLEE